MNGNIFLRKQTQAVYCKARRSMQITSSRQQLVLMSSHHSVINVRTASASAAAFVEIQFKSNKLDCICSPLSVLNTDNERLAGDDKRTIPYVTISGANQLGQMSSVNIITAICSTDYVPI